MVADSVVPGIDCSETVALSEPEFEEDTVDVIETELLRLRERFFLDFGLASTTETKELSFESKPSRS